VGALLNEGPLPREQQAGASEGEAGQRREAGGEAAEAEPGPVQLAIPRELRALRGQLAEMTENQAEMRRELAHIKIALKGCDAERRSARF